MISIDFSPASQELHRMQRELTIQGPSWPSPRTDNPLITPELFDLASQQWLDRVRAAYISVGRANQFLDHLLALGAPLDLINGASYITDELTRHLSLTAHIAAHIAGDEPIILDENLLRRSPDPPSWVGLLQQGVELFGFNFAISVPLFEAISTVTFDQAIAELTAAQRDSYAEIVGFGQALLLWISRKIPSPESLTVEESLPSLLHEYERLCKGSPQFLDELAGAEIAIESTVGNLGSLVPRQLAAIFYHSLNASIFPLLDELGWEGVEAWRQHYLTSPNGRIAPPVVAALGASFPRNS